jgi:hypothetical protein
LKIISNPDPILSISGIPASIKQEFLISDPNDKQKSNSTPGHSHVITGHLAMIPVYLLLIPGHLPMIQLYFSMSAKKRPVNMANLCHVHWSFVHFSYCRSKVLGDFLYGSHSVLQSPRSALALLHCLSKILGLLG